VREEGREKERRETWGRGREGEREGEREGGREGGREGESERARAVRVRALHVCVRESVVCVAMCICLLTSKYKYLT
jgi:hypothetical protein